MSSSEAMNRYWIPNMDIHKKVIVAEIQYHLGPQASVRPFTKEVRSFLGLSCSHNQLGEN